MNILQRLYKTHTYEVSETNLSQLV